MKLTIPSRTHTQAHKCGCTYTETWEGGVLAMIDELTCVRHTSETLQTFPDVVSPDAVSMRTVSTFHKEKP